MTDEKKEEWIRRPYTRSIPVKLRSLAQLEESTVDATTQWYELLEQLVTETDVKGILQQTTKRKAARKLEELASQLRAVMQEMTAQSGRVVREGVDTQSFEQFCAWAGSTPSLQTTEASNGCTQMDKLCARVCMLCLCVAVILNDLELLICGMSFAESHKLLETYSRECEQRSVRQSNSIPDSGMEKGKNSEDVVLCSTVAHTLICGNDHNTFVPLADGDVLLACTLLYYLYTQDGPSASKSVMILERVLHYAEEVGYTSDVLDETGGYRIDFFYTISRMANWVETDNCPRLYQRIAHGFQGGSEVLVPFPPFVFLFTQVMLHMVVRRRLVEMQLQNVWRPVVTMDAAPVGCDGTAAETCSHVHPTVSSTSLCSAHGSKSFAVCLMLQRACLSQYRSWPLPMELQKSFFC
ncbi:uncharacterized protein TEOVI_000458700 [Trypanosoma equiperdum]|uniref:Uncharacterized protein n=1 Tax=Trypanosoma equiperdum TaxID=5694 RepID=A0A1G4IKA9_TRYEQ|nr:hypothetical protein, conserved [Trypanosoma equiperdum]